MLNRDCCEDLHNVRSRQHGTSACEALHHFQGCSPAPVLHHRADGTRSPRSGLVQPPPAQQHGPVSNAIVHVSCARRRLSKRAARCAHNIPHLDSADGRFARAGRGALAISASVSRPAANAFLGISADTRPSSACRARSLVAAWLSSPTSIVISSAAALTAATSTRIPCPHPRRRPPWLAR